MIPTTRKPEQLMPDTQSTAKEIFDSLREGDEAADKLLAEADATELRQLLDKSQLQCRKLKEGIRILFEHYAVDKSEPRKTESDSVVIAMQSVALAAIDLAKEFSPKK